MLKSRRLVGAVVSIVLAGAIASVPASASTASTSAGEASIYQVSHQYPFDFAGVAASKDGSPVLMVARDANAKRLSKALTGNLLRVPTRLVAKSLQQLESEQAYVADDLASNIRPTLRGVGIDPGANSLVVYTADPSADTEWIKARYGVDVRIEFTAPIEAQGRQNDSPAYYAGGRVYYGTRGCTNGFSVAIGSTKYTLTSGHCFSLNNAISNGDYSLEVGKVVKRQLGTNQLDIEFIGGKTYAGNSWIGSSSSSTQAPVRYLGYGSAYGYVNVGGSYTGEAASKIQTSDPSIGSCFTVSGRATCGLVKTRTDSSRACQDGDSGGPVYTKSSGLITAIGIHTGGSTDGRDCYYTILGRVLGYYGATLVTG